MGKSSSLIEVKMGFDTLKDIFFPQPPKFTELTFTPYAYYKMMSYTHLIGEYEITGFGRIVDGRVIDVKILRQTVKPAEVDCDVEAMEEFLLSTPRDELGQWVLDFHSHVNMGVFASGTDSSNYEKQFLSRRRKQFPLLIVNKRGEMYSKCYISPDKQSDLKITIDNSTPLTEEELLGIYEDCKKDIETLCKKQTYTSSAFGYNYYKGNYKTSEDYEDWYEDYYNNKYYSQQHLPTTHCGSTGSKNTKKNEVIDCKSLDSYDICKSCGCVMAYEDECERGLCDDCWQQLPPNQQVDWLKANNLTIK